MWTCPKCGRTFARNGQDHYCGKPPETIDEYILNQPEKAQPLLKEINETIRAAIPDTMEKISWSLQRLKIMWDCIRDRKLWRNLQTV
jgi:hypothetical protein